MTTNASSTRSPRRTFLQRIAGLSAMVAAGGAPATLHAAQPAADPWLAKVTGKHKQVFDIPDVNGGFGSIYAATYIGTMTSAYKLTPADVHAVLVYRHGAMPLTLNDAMWEKYRIGAMLGVTDPVTKGPATRNIFYMSKAGDIPFPDASIAKVMAMPATLVACGAALQVLSQRAAESMKMDPVAAQQDWSSNLLPGVHVVPSGVMAVARAQEIGCTYCFAG